MISIYGITGMVGSAVAEQAGIQGLSVEGYSRNVTPESRIPGMNYHQGDLGDTEQVVSVINSSEATVIATSPRGRADAGEKLIQNHKDLIAANPQGRVLVVVGAASLLVDGVPLRDTPDFPDDYKEEADVMAQVLELYKNSEGINWTAISPSPEIFPGKAQEYVTAGDDVAGLEVTTSTFGLAIVDEIKNKKHGQQRFTVANRVTKDTN